MLPDAEPTPTPIQIGLHDGQIQVYAAPTRFKVVVAGRRWGKTQLAKVRLLTWGLRRAGRYWYVAPTQKMAKDIFWDEFKEAAQPWTIARHETELKVTLTGGATVSLLGAEEPDNLRGRGLRGLVLDEYADMDGTVWPTHLRPALADFKAPALIIGTPKSFNHFYDFAQRGANPEFPGWQAWHFRSLDNPLLDPDEIEEARRTTDPRTFRQEWEASFEALAGRAYYAFDRQENVGPVRLEPHEPACVWFDFNIEPATGGIGVRRGDDVLVWRCVKLTHTGGEATVAVARALKEHLRAGHHRGEVRIYGDATGKSGKTTGPSDHAVVRSEFPGALWCIPRANPHERDRVAAVNGRCLTAVGVRHLMVNNDASCLPLIADLEQVIYAENGEIDKKSNPMLTHLSDGLGYWLVRDFPPAPKVKFGTAAAPHLSDLI